MTRESTLEEILAAREKRAERQKRMLSGEPEGVLVWLCMNAPGSVKRSKWLDYGAHRGHQLVEDLLRFEPFSVTETHAWMTAAGLEYSWLLRPQEESGERSAREHAAAVKARMQEIEEYHPLGRLLDIDVLCVDRKISRTELGLPPRRCLLCGRPAAECARSQAHAVPDLMAREEVLLRSDFREQLADHVGELAQRALLYEVCTTPKPGLVDRVNNGAHADMDIYTFQRSTAALGPFFRDCVKLGMKGQQMDLSAEAAYLGKLAEAQMRRATGGVNTHQGAVFSLGYLCIACGSAMGDGRRASVEDVIESAAELYEQSADCAAHPDPEGARRALLDRYRGITEQVLPWLEMQLAASDNLDLAGTGALLRILADTKDTNMIRRGGTQTAEEMRQWAAACLQQQADPRQAMAEMDAAYIERNLSCGGCADLLAVTWFLYFLSQEVI